jgi:hypothetical protein
MNEASSHCSAPRRFGGARAMADGSLAAQRTQFTIITAVFNGTADIGRTIDSLARQKFRDFEFIVVDGGSGDGTVAALEHHRAEIDFWISEPDTGIYSAWNKGLRLANGEWIAFLGAGDCYMPDALESYAKFIATLPSPPPQFISSRIALVDGRGGQRLIGRPWRWPAFSRFMTVAHVGALHHRSLFNQFGAFDERFRICGDYELLLRPRAALRTAFLNKKTAEMAAGGLSNTNVSVAFRESERAKSETGGRSRILSAIERHEAMFRFKAKSRSSSLGRRQPPTVGN